MADDSGHYFWGENGKAGIKRGDVSKHGWEGLKRCFFLINVRIRGQSNDVIEVRCIVNTEYETTRTQTTERRAHIKIKRNPVFLPRVL